MTMDGEAHQHTLEDAADQAHAADGASRRPRRTESAAAASCSPFGEHRCAVFDGRSSMEAGTR
jgi:hypothetical protein